MSLFDLWEMKKPPQMRWLFCSGLLDKHLFRIYTTTNKVALYYSMGNWTPADVRKLAAFLLFDILLKNRV